MTTVSADATRIVWSGIPSDSAGFDVLLPDLYSGKYHDYSVGPPTDGAPMPTSGDISLAGVPPTASALTTVGPVRVYFFDNVLPSQADGVTFPLPGTWAAFDPTNSFYASSGSLSPFAAVGGVLKVNVGTVAVPDWRKVGCGGGAPTYTPPASGADIYWLGVNPADPSEYAFTIVASSPLPANTVYAEIIDAGLPRLTQETPGGLVFIGGSVPISAGYDVGFTGETNPASSYAYVHFRDASLGGTGGFLINWPVKDGSPSAGRLKLWDGTQWLREACDDDSGAADDFNRTASSLGTTSVGALPWSVLLGAWETNGAARSTAVGAFTGGGSGAVAVVDAGVADTELSLTVYNESGGSGTDPSGIAFRAVDGQNFLLAYVTGLYKISSGTFTTLASWATVPAGSVLGVTLSGSSITVTKNGSTSLAVVTETFQQTATKHGLYGGQVGAEMDDFTLGTPAASHPLKLWDGSAWRTVACMTPA